MGFKIARKFLNIASIVSGTLFLIVGTAVFYFFYQSGKEMAENKLLISSLEKEILSLNKNESYLITVDDRLGKIQKILQEQKRKADFFEDLKYVSVPGFSLSSLELSSTNRLVRLNFYCQDSQCLSNLNSRVEELIRDKKYTQVLLPGLIRDSEKRYSLSMEWKE